MKYYDVSNWRCDSGTSNTKGSRDKIILFEPNTDNEYFMKFPMKKGDRNYSMETWSEILAFEIGTFLGFNVLRYDFGMNNGRPGCISKNMVHKGDFESLIEGDSILMAYDPTYNPKEKKSYNKYTFSFVMKALKAQKLERYSKDFVRILIFDAIIGNSDRHQSNWGFIQRKEKPKSFFKPRSWFSKNNPPIEMSPIYDSGCCLGREFGEEQIKERLDDINKFYSFIHKGYAELRTDKESTKKISHFKLLQSICNIKDWNLFVLNEITKIADVYTKGKTNIGEIISNIDSPLPDKIRTDFGMSEQRKQFIIKVIDSRINELKKIANVSTD